MYEIIGGDGKEYGPVSFEELGAWLREGRVSLQTMVRRDGGDWMPFAELPEFQSGEAPPDLPGDRASNETVAEAAVAGPATALLIVGILHLIACITGIQQVAVMANLPPEALNALPPEVLEIVQQASPGARTAGLIIGLLSGVLMIVASQKMRHLQSYGLVVTGLILAMLPCTDQCCCIGLPIGIWGLMVLSRPEVRAAFR